MDRAEETDVRRARSLSCSGDQSSPSAAAAATASAAKAEALEARPEAVGKSLRLVTCARCETPADARTRSRRPETRRRAPAPAGRRAAVGSFAGAPSRIEVPPSSSSSSPSEGSNATVVMVLIPASGTERLGTAGRLCPSSSFPQYLARAMLGCATAVAVCIFGIWFGMASVRSPGSAARLVQRRFLPRALQTRCSRRRATHRGQRSR